MGFGKSFRKLVSFVRLQRDDKKPTINNLPVDKTDVELGRSNPQQNGGDVFVYDAKSWNKQTHPDGMGPSKLVRDFEYDADSGKLQVTYRDGFTAEYDNITPDQAQKFAKADSKGRWALAVLWNRPYREV